MRLSIETSSQLKASRQRLARLPLIAVIVLALATLACALIGPNQSASRRVVIRPHLPTLTPTALPALTPTLSPSPAQSAALAAEPVLATPTPILEPTFTPASGDLSAAASAAPPANSDPTLTALVVLNVRAGPGVDYPILGKLAPNESFQITGRTPDGTWWQIIYPPGSGSPGGVSADAQHSTASGGEAEQIAQLPPPPPPTATPTPLPTVPAALTPLPTNAPEDQLPSTSTPAPSGTPLAGPTATPLAGPPGWTFASVRLYPDQEDSLLLLGDMINNTGASQELAYVTGTFYDAQGQVIADQDRTFDTWPIDTIPPGGRIPFELTVDGIQNAANFDLNVEAEPSDKTPRQDFEFLDVNPSNDNGYYCLKGKLRNPGSELQSYLTIVAILYDAQDNVVNFNTFYKPSPEDLAGDKTLRFEMCVDSLNQAVVRHELRAWGLL